MLQHFERSNKFGILKITYYSLDISGSTNKEAMTVKFDLNRITLGLGMPKNVDISQTQK